MVNAGRLFWQIVKIVAGYGLALSSAGLFLAWGFFRPEGIDADPIGLAATIWTGLLSGVIIGGAAFIPAFAAIVAAEILRLKSVFFHVAAGGIIAFALWTLSEPNGGHTLRPGSSIALAAGFVAGFVYWLIAGRTSGYWRITRGNEPSPGT